MKVGKKVYPVGCLSLAKLNWDSQLGKLFSLPSQRNFPISFKSKLVTAKFIGKMQQKVWYYEKWVGRHASFPLRQSVKRSQLCEFVILQTVMYLDTLKNYLPKIVQSSFKFHKRMMFPYYTCTSRCHCTSILECKFVDYWSGVGGEGIYYAFSGYAKREFLGFAPFFFSLWSPETKVE